VTERVPYERVIQRLEKKPVKRFVTRIEYVPVERVEEIDDFEEVTVNETVTEY